MVKLVGIPSYTGNFGAMNLCFEVCKGFLINTHGIYIKEFERNNYKSIIFSNVDSLVFDVISPCHLDVVVAEKYELKIDKNTSRLLGRGVFDMKGFVASNLINLKFLAEKNSNISYGVVITSDEETGGENGMKYLVENVGLKTNLVLDSDKGGNISSIAKENLGAMTIKLYGGRENIKKTIQSIKNVFRGYHCEDYGDEMDINFGDINIHQTLGDCMDKNVTSQILMFNDYIKYDINDKYHQLYRHIAETAGLKINYTTTNGTNDSRYFSTDNVSVITHQAIGGDSHEETEWLDLGSLHIFNKIQRKFLVNLPKNNCNF